MSSPSLLYTTPPADTSLTVGVLRGFAERLAPPVLVCDVPLVCGVADLGDGAAAGGLAAGLGRRRRRLLRFGPPSPSLPDAI